VQLLWKSVWEFLKKLVLYDPATLLLGINKKECKSAFNRDTCTAIFIVALFTIAKPCNPHLSTDKWILKNVKMYIYNTEYYSAIKKNGIMPFAGKWMELEIIVLSEMGQAKKDKYCMFSVICRI
jgi:hypothetical protein